MHAQVPEYDAENTSGTVHNAVEKGAVMTCFIYNAEPEDVVAL